MTTSREKGTRVWRPEDLQRENLNFNFVQRLSFAEAMAVWYWELDREMGTVVEPFVRRPKPPCASASESPNHEVPLPLGLRYHKLGSLLPLITPSTDSLRVRGVPRSRIHAFEINWEIPWPQVVAAFNAWGKKQSSYRIKYPDCAEEPSPDEDAKLHPPWPTVKRGRNDSCGAWLDELRAYRISTAGLKRSEGLDLLKKLRIIGDGIEVASSNWSHAIKRSRRRIMLYRMVLDCLPGSPFSFPLGVPQSDRVCPHTELAWSLLEYFGRPWIAGRSRSPADLSIPERAWDSIHSHPVANRAPIRIKSV